VLLDILLGLIVLIAIAALGTFIMHAVLRVPYVPTSRWIAREMVKAASLKGNETVYDLGAGDGVLLLTAKRSAPGIRAIGCELVPTIWLLGYVRCLLSRKHIEFRLGSALQQDLHDADVLLLYLTPPLLRKLVPKFRGELKPGTRIVSHAFTLPGVPGGERLGVYHGWRKAVLHVYHWPSIAA
jgi:hypothetical protein